MGYSAYVEMHVRVGDKLLQAGQLGPEWFILRDDAAIEPCYAEIRMRVDDHTEHIPVYLPNGIQPGVTKTRYVKLDQPRIEDRPRQRLFNWASDF